VIRRWPLRSAAIVLFAVAVAAVLSVRSLDEPRASTTASPSDGDGVTASPAEVLTPTSRAHARHTGGVLIVGDSLVVGADKFGLSKILKADGWHVEVDAEEGRSTRSGIAAIVERHDVPALVVVELGTNPSAALSVFPDELRQMLDALYERGAQRVIWVTPHHRDDGRYDARDQAIFDAAAQDNRLVVANWHAYAAGHREWMRSDGLHYTDPGYAILAAFLTDIIDSNDPTS
jgi:lysophospholipase L1-like esterase